MAELPIIAYHMSFGAYGFWLPNDPRGSWSDYVWAERLRPFGPVTKVNTRRSLAHEKHDRELRLAAKKALKYPPVTFTGIQARAVARGFAEIITKLKLAVFATAIMPDHVHLVLARQHLHVETIAGYLKRAASRQLRKEGLHPFQSLKAGHVVDDVAKRSPGLNELGSLAHDGASDRLPTPWEENGWKVYLHTLDEVLHAINYVNDNPMKAGLPRQFWPWIVPFEI